MKELVVVTILISVAMCGCVTNESSSRPIVSPEKISVESSGSGEPSIPFYKPIWEK